MSVLKVKSERDLGDYKVCIFDFIIRKLEVYWFIMSYYLLMRYCEFY